MRRTRPTGDVSRRTVLQRVGLAGTGLAVGIGGLAGQASAEEGACGGCLRVCWVDVKPDSCPNSVNPNSGGTLPVSAGWPNFEESTVELVPVSATYDAAFDGCQDYSDPRYRAGAAAELCRLAAASDRGASPTWSRIEDVDGDGDDDVKFRFDVSDLDLSPGDTHLVLRGESTTDDCTYLGIDTVRVVGGGTQQSGDANRNADAGASGRGRGRGGRGRGP